MKSASRILIAVLLTLAIAKAADTFNAQASIKCFHTVEYRFFNLKPLMKESEELYYSQDWTDTTGENRVIDFDFCEPLPTTRHCNGNSSLAVDSSRVSEFQETCHSLTLAPSKAPELELIETNEDVEEHIILRFATEEKCTEEQNFGINFEIFCDPEITEVTHTRNEVNSTDCTHTIEIHHQAGCKVGDLNAIWRFIEANNWIFAIVFAAIGTFILILGRKLIRPTLAIIFCLTTVAVILFLFYALILPKDVAKWVGWVILAISVILGSIVGFFASKLIRIGVFFLGVWAGIGIALILNNTVFYKINHVAVLWSMIVVFGLVLGVLSFVWYHYICIVCTSILGGFLLVRGVSLVAGGYPNEFTIFERIRDGDISAVPWTFYLYLVGMLVLIAIGIFVQIKIKKAEKDDKGSQNDYYKRV